MDPHEDKSSSAGLLPKTRRWLFGQTKGDLGKGYRLRKNVLPKDEGHSESQGDVGKRKRCSVGSPTNSPMSCRLQRSSPWDKAIEMRSCRLGKVSPKAKRARAQRRRVSSGKMRSTRREVVARSHTDCVCARREMEGSLGGLPEHIISGWHRWMYQMKRISMWLNGARCDF